MKKPALLNVQPIDSLTTNFLIFTSPLKCLTKNIQQTHQNQKLIIDEEAILCLKYDSMERRTNEYSL